MTLEQATEQLSAKFPGRYLSVTYEMIVTASGSKSVEIKGYVADLGWSPAFHTYDSVVIFFLSEQKIDSSPSDGSDE